MARNRGRKKSGWRRVSSPREVRPDGAHASEWAYQAALADNAASERDAARTAQAIQEAANTAEGARAEKAAQAEANAARRQAQLAPRPCLRCGEVLPPEAFEPHHRAYNGRMGCCRPCAKLIRDRKAAPVGRRKAEVSPRSCRGCRIMFTPPHGKHVYCSEDCRLLRQKDEANARRRAARAADPAAERLYRKRYRATNEEKCRQHRRRYAALHRAQETAAHAEWVAKNRRRINAYMREFRQRRQATAEAKRDFGKAGVFLLVRARSGFWRGHAPGRPVGRTETVIARYERVGADWVTRPPALACEAIRRRVIRWAYIEDRRLRNEKGEACK